MPPTRIRHAEIDFLSLVPRGKNKLRTLLKERDGEGRVEVVTLLKEAPDFGTKGELLAVVYTPDRPDHEGHWADAETIEKMATSFMERGAKLDLRHDGKAIPRDKAAVSQSFIIQKGDPRFDDLTDEDGQAVNAAGGWATVIKLKDPDLRAKYESGEWGAVSMGGRAILEKEHDATASKDFDEDRLVDRIKRVLGLKKEKDVPMDKAELEAVLAKQHEKTIAFVKELLQKERPGGEEPGGGDKPTARKDEPKAKTAADLRKEADELEFAEAVKNGDHKALRKLAERMEKGAQSEAEMLRKELDEKQARLDKLEGRSGQGGGDGDPLNKGVDDDQLTEADLALVKELNGEGS